MMTEVKNAGLRLLAAQKEQGTNLCIGLDPHLDQGPDGVLTPAFYAQFADEGEINFFDAVGSLRANKLLRINREPMIGSTKLYRFLAGLANYLLKIVAYSWECGIRVFKPQAAFYERFGPLGGIVLHLVVERIHQLGMGIGWPYFIIGDVKRGDIDITMAGYYDGYLGSQGQEVVPGLFNQFCFNAITVLTWMGIESVLKPGLPYFKEGCGAIPVARSTNPDGTTLQDARILPYVPIPLNEKQEAYRFSWQQHAEIAGLIGRQPTTAEVMMYLCEKFSQKNELNSPDGISPIFNVIGSTVVEDGTFRKIRPGGIALVPGFGAQGGKFANAMPMLMKDGPFIGQGAIFSSSRGHNYPWLKEFGGSGDPKNLKNDLEDAIARFCEAEKKAYAEAKINYPY